MRGLRLGFSLWRRDDRFQGSVSEPDPRSRRLKAGCHAGRALQIGAGTSPGTRARPRFRHRCKVSTLHQRFTFVRLRGPYLTRSWPRLLTRRSPRRLLIAAARADLQPDSASRLREACSHLRHSFLLHTARLFHSCSTRGVAGVTRSICPWPATFGGRRFKGWTMVPLAVSMRLWLNRNLHMTVWFRR